MSHPHASYPALRLRRTRSAAWSRAMVAETFLSPANLIWPLFVTEGENAEEPIATLPGVSRWSVDRIVDRAKEAAALGIPCVALFPNTPRHLRSERIRRSRFALATSGEPGELKRTRSTSSTWASRPGPSPAVSKTFLRFRSW